jgi:hypothetical protein
MGWLTNNPTQRYLQVAVARLKQGASTLARGPMRSRVGPRARYLASLPAPRQLPVVNRDNCRGVTGYCRATHR